VQKLAVERSAPSTPASKVAKSPEGPAQAAPVGKPATPAPVDAMGSLPPPDAESGTPTAPAGPPEQLQGDAAPAQAAKAMEESNNDSDVPRGLEITEGLGVLDVLEEETPKAAPPRAEAGAAAPSVSPPKWPWQQAQEEPAAQASGWLAAPCGLSSFWPAK